MIRKLSVLALTAVFSIGLLPMCSLADEVTPVLADAPAIEKAVTTDREISSVTITFNANGGKGTMNAMVGSWGDAVDLDPCTFKRSGYKFTGWNTAKDGSGISYTDKDHLFFEEDMVLYAQWKKQTKITLSVSAKKTLKKSNNYFLVKVTVKYNGKKKKNKKVTVRFNGKKFKKYTNSKGIAQIKVTRSAYKRIKAGKKVKYKITHSNKTKYRYVRIKK